MIPLLFEKKITSWRNFSQCIGGKMVVPLGGRSSQTMTLVEKTTEKEYKTSKHGAFVFVPMLKGKV